MESATLPLSTIYSRPNFCSSRSLTFAYETIGNQVILGTDYLSGTDQPGRSCYPSGLIGSTGGRPVNLWSPGACPQDYTMFPWYTTDEETRGACCPQWVHLQRSMLEIS